TIGPLFIRATVTPETEVVTLDVLWSLSIPPNTVGASVEQDLYLLWPNAVDGDSSAGPPDAAMAAYVKSRGRTPIAAARLPLLAKSLYRIGEELPPEPVRGGAPFVTFVRQGGPLAGDVRADPLDAAAGQPHVADESPHGAHRPREAAQGHVDR